MYTCLESISDRLFKCCFLTCPTSQKSKPKKSHLGLRLEEKPEEKEILANRLRGKWRLLTKRLKQHLSSELLTFTEDELNWEQGKFYIDLILSFIAADRKNDLPRKICALERISPRDVDHFVKILFIGDSGVGKTCLRHRITYDSLADYKESYTLGIDFSRVQLRDVDGATIQTQMWDTSGQERFRTITTAYFRGVHGIVLVYDVTYAHSFQGLHHWVTLLEHHVKESTKVILIGNKSDWELHRQVAIEDGEKFAKQHGYQFAEVSANSGEGTQHLLSKFVLSIID